jgi:putative DNA primase/helicase
MTDLQAETLPALAQLQARPQWVCWHWEERKSKKTKVPYNPKTGRMAEANHPATWASYVLAQEALHRQPGRYHGLGYMFARDVTGIDLDHCIAPDGTIDAWAQRYLEHLPSYSEKTPSGEGIHILLPDVLPGQGIRRVLKGQRHAQAAVEMYCEGRYFTITGKHLESTPVTLASHQEALIRLYAELATPATRAQPAQLVPETLLDDAALLKKAEEASNGDKFHRLFSLGAEGYGSASEADMALCVLLAFWTGRDQVRMDQLFRQSALYRDKWDTARGGSTYGQETIRKAAQKCGVVYDPQRNRRQLDDDIQQLLHHIATHQENLHQHPAGKKHKPYQLQPRVVSSEKVLDYLEKNEYGDALFFADAFAGQICYDHTNGEWYLWNGHSWKQDAISKVRPLVAGVLGSLYLRVQAELNTSYSNLELQIRTLDEKREPTEALEKQAKALATTMETLRTRARGLRSAKRMHNVLIFAQSEVGITSEMWDTQPWLLGTPNGVIDLRTGELRPGRPEEYIRTIVPTEWTGLHTPCTRFERFLQEIFEEKADREELIAFLQRLLGYGITGFTTHHLFPILYGKEGRNGKDTLLTLLKSVLGNIVGAVSNDVFVAQDKMRAAGAATSHLCDLQGKRLAWGSETKEGDRLNIAQVKLLTGGGDIPARQIHGKQYSFPPTHKLLLLTNFKPHADARDKAFWARACLIDFGIRYVDAPQAPNERKADPQLIEALRKEGSGILAWLVRGCLAWQAQGLSIPPSIQMATDKYREEEDRLLLFLQECCLLKPDASVGAGALFKAYHSWHETNQFGGRSLDGTKFGEEIRKRFQRVERNGRRIYLGVGLLTSEDGPATLFDAQEKTRHPYIAVGRDLVEGGEIPSTSAEPASEANEDASQNTLSRGGRGVSPLFPQNVLPTPPIEAKTGFTPLPPLQTKSVIIGKSASEADRETVEGEGGASTDPLPNRDVRMCVTRWEKSHKQAHLERATCFSAGCWWCERCAPQRTLMEFGEQHHYPKLEVRSKGFTIATGRAKWLTFVQEAGYILVQRALDAASTLPPRTENAGQRGDTPHA